jgi:hypothetical protein
MERELSTKLGITQHGVMSRYSYVLLLDNIITIMIILLLLDNIITITMIQEEVKFTNALL